MNYKYNSSSKDHELSEAMQNNNFDTPLSLSDQRLAIAGREEQVIAVREWFLSRYCNPAENTPYDGHEGGYFFTDGGPFDPQNEIDERFSEVVPENVMQEVIEEMHNTFGDQWALSHSNYDDLDFTLNFDTSEEPLRLLRQRLEQAKKVLTLRGDDSAKNLAKHLVFGSVISTLEAFLWETADYWVEKNDCVLHECITKLPDFRDQSIKLGDILKHHSNLRSYVKEYLKNLVWHRWRKVEPLYRLGLGIQLPSTKPFTTAMIKRHDIVHRSGHNKDGVKIDVTELEIIDLCSEVEQFAMSIETALAAKNSH